MDDISPILIVGAGPSGLMAANVLARFDIPFRIIEQKTEMTQTSNALAMHSRTLELMQVLGLADDFIEKGRPIKIMQAYTKTKKLFEIKFDGLKTDYPFVLAIPQSHSEIVLNQSLAKFGRSVERNCKFLSYRKFDDYYEVDIQNSNDKIETIKTHWILACDGYHSQVREQSDVSYKGQELEQNFIMMDAVLEGDQQAMRTYLHPDGVVMCIPYKEATRVIIEIDHDPAYNKHTEPEQSVFENILQARCPNLIKIKNITWMSKFWIHERQVSQYRDGSVFFVGDAAHVHSPVGGQGMNYSIQDAFNIAWKLAMVVKGQINVNILDSYHAERYPLAKTLLDNTTTMTKVVGIKNPLLIFLRNQIFSFMLKFSKVQSQILKALSELTINYRSSPIVKDCLNLKIKAGDRAPEVFEGLRHVLLIFPGVLDVGEIKKVVVDKYLAWIDVIEVDENDVKRIKLWRGMTGICLVRPDQYLGFVGARLEEFQKYLMGFS